MHLKGIQGNHMVTITWVRMMQCNAIKEKDMTGKHLSSKHNRQTQKAKGVGAAIREFRFNLF